VKASATIFFAAAVIMREVESAAAITLTIFAKDLLLTPHAMLGCGVVFQRTT